MRYRLLFLVCACGFVARGLPGQVAPTSVPIDGGTLVRMTPQIGPLFKGRLVQRLPADGSALFICRYPGPPCADRADSTAIRRVEIASLLHLDLQRGSHAGTGTIIGGRIGVALFSAGGSFGHPLCETEDCGPSTSALTLRGAIAGAVLGALFGAASPVWGPAR